MTSLYFTINHHCHVAVTAHTLACSGYYWLQCGDIADVRLAQKHIRGRACKFGYVEFQTKVVVIIS